MNAIAIITIVTLTLVVFAVAAVAVIINSQLKAADRELRNALDYAQKVARSIYVNHYRHTSLHWEEEDTICGVISQIDNMATGLIRQNNDWTPSQNKNYDRSIHSNPDAKAWADFFVATFPGQAARHELMVGWFANAMMAMRDAIKQGKFS